MIRRWTQTDHRWTQTDHLEDLQYRIVISDDLHVSYVERRYTYNGSILDDKDVPGWWYYT